MYIDRINMKSKKLQLFLIFLGVLVIAGLGGSVVEGLHNNEKKSAKSRKSVKSDTHSMANHESSNTQSKYSSFNSVPSTPGYTTAESSDGPEGVPASAIPPGDEDLYILKSEIVPPVCPACPTTSSCPRQKPCQPCPPCARCPEPAFECKKVPNYRSGDSTYLPKPVLSDFSQFGM